MDNITSAQKRISYARILVEIKARQDWVKLVRVKLVGGSIIEQRILYEWQPPKCENHWTKQRLMQKVWKKKKKPLEPIIKGSEENIAEEKEGIDNIT